MQLFLMIILVAWASWNSVEHTDYQVTIKEKVSVAEIKATTKDGRTNDYEIDSRLDVDKTFASIKSGDCFEARHYDGLLIHYGALRSRCGEPFKYATKVPVDKPILPRKTQAEVDQVLKDTKEYLKDKK